METRKEPATKPPGLTWPPGKPPRWRATKAAIKAGYPVKSVNLSIHADDPPALARRCERLQTEMLAWLSGRAGKVLRFDGTIGSIVRVYTDDPESPFNTQIKHATRKPYAVYARMIAVEVGDVRLDDCDGRDVRRWFNAWSEPDKAGGRPQIAKARMAIAVLKSALSFGIQCRMAGCADFKAVLDEIRFPTLKPRRIVPSVQQIIAARKEARARGHGAAALAYALQFEGPARQWDIIGQWVPISDRAASAVVDGNDKWIGPHWRDVDENLVLRYTPSKTERTTGAEIVIDMRCCPMVMEELAHIPAEQRSGPLIPNPATGLPYRQWYYRDLWREVARACDIPDEVWNRDLRAGGATEARQAQASYDDLRKVMGHAADSNVTANVYDRAALDAHRRVAQARAKHRSSKK